MGYPLSPDRPLEPRFRSFGELLPGSLGGLDGMKLPPVGQRCVRIEKSLEVVKPRGLEFPGPLGTQLFERAWLPHQETAGPPVSFAGSALLIVPPMLFARMISWAAASLSFTAITSSKNFSVTWIHSRFS